MAQRHVASDPYPWPFDGGLRRENTALVVIDMQTDFCGIGGYVDRMGYDLNLTRSRRSPPYSRKCVALGPTSPTRAKGIGLTLVRRPRWHVLCLIVHKTVMSIDPSN
jgi:hypothetical protein